MCLGVRELDGASGSSNSVCKQPKARDIPRCKALGCSVDLSEHKVYCQRKQLCPEHIQADAVRVAGSSKLYRFCFQCGKLQDLTCFDSNKRSCRQRLEQRRNNLSSKKGASRAKHSSAPRAAHTAADADCMLAEAEQQDWEAAGHTAAAPSELPEWPSSDCSSDTPLQLLQHGSHQLSASEGASAGGGGSSGCSELGAWEASAMHCMAQAPAASAGSWPAGDVYAASAAATAHGFGALPFSHLEDLLSDGTSDADSLQLVLESELTAAALGAAIANPSNHARDEQSQQLSQHLAAVLVQDSGLFGATAGLPTPMPAPQQQQQLCAVPMCAPTAAGPLYTQHSVVSGNNMPWGVSAEFSPAHVCSSSPAVLRPVGAGPAPWASPAASSCVPVLAGMAVTPACPMGAAAQPMPAPGCFVQPCMLPADLPAVAAAAAPALVLADQSVRLAQLRLQMADLQGRVAMLRQQFGL